MRRIRRGNRNHMVFFKFLSVKLYWMKFDAFFNSITKSFFWNNGAKMRLNPWLRHRQNYRLCFARFFLKRPLPPDGPPETYNSCKRYCHGVCSFIGSASSELYLCSHEMTCQFSCGLWIYGSFSEVGWKCAMYLHNF